MEERARGFEVVGRCEEAGLRSLVAQVSCCHSLCRHRAIRNDYGAMDPAHSPTKNTILYLIYLALEAVALYE